MIGSFSFDWRIGLSGKKDRATYDSCLNNAPYFAYQIEGKRYGVVQGCCNDWNCPKCGQQRAREEYGRIVAGAREIGKTHDLYIFTVTCRGKDCSLEEAENNYLEWTNRLLTRLRAETKRSGKEWYYASVTERQDRMHPHSHYLTTYCPNDAVLVKKGQKKDMCFLPSGILAKHDTLQSFALERACAECGLGYQYDISRLESIEAGSRYVSKYLFKDTIFTTKWPKGWRRVRYSRNWPKLPEIHGDAFILLTKFDWYRLAQLAVTVKTQNDEASQHVKQQLSHMAVFVD